MTKKEAIFKMNKLGTSKTPFLFIIDFEMESCIVEKLDEINNDDIKFSFNNYSNVENKNINQNIELNVLPPKYDEYFKSFEIVKDNILLGNTYLVNLTFSSEINVNANLESIFYQSKAKYKLLYKNKFTFFSPEIFVKIIDSKIFSYPMKGTIDASIPDAKTKILNDEKEIAEHYTIVDLIRNDLNIVAKNVKVEKFRYVDYIATNKKNILQLSSKISGDLDKNYNNQIGNIIFSLLPAGSISGAPKKKTIEIINMAEKNKRGYYTGVAGVFDGENVDSCVIIRFIEQKNDGLYYRSGGGITFKSKPIKEYEELIDKIYIPK